MACPHGLQFIFCQHILDVLSCSAARMGSKSSARLGSFPLCQDSKTKEPVTKLAARVVVSSPFLLKSNFGTGCLFLAGHRHRNHNSFLSCVLKEKKKGCK